MKTLKIAVLSISLIFTIMYLAFLFVLPNAVDLNKYSHQIIKKIQNNTEFQCELKGLKIKTFWNLSIGAFIDKTDLKYSNGKKFAQINGLRVKLSLLPLILGKIHVNNIDADKILANINKEETGNRKQEIDFSPLTSHYSHNMPDFNVKKYRISFIDANNNYTIKGTDLKISDFILNKKIKIKSKGNLILNNRKQVAYNIAIFSEIFPEGGKRKIEIIKIFDDLYKYNVNANISADLEINNKKNVPDIHGKIDVDKMSFAVGGKVFPKSSLKLAFIDDKVKINSSFNFDSASKALITGIFKIGKNKSIDLQVMSDRANINNIILIANAISKLFGIKDLKNISANGLLKADFKIKSDFKKVQSSGYLKIENANLTSKLYNVSLNSLNADVDFSGDTIHINKAKANLNGQPITVSGVIDKNANANVLVLANKLPLKGVLLAFKQTKILKENNILDGGVNVKVDLKGRLDKAILRVDASVNDINLQNIKTRAQIKLAKAIINTAYSKNTTGKIEITGLKIHLPTLVALSVPKTSLIFDKNDLRLEKSVLYINNITTNMSGKISDINSAPHLNLITISIPNRISVPIMGYLGSNMVLKGNLVLNGDLYNPQIQGGGINILSISIPSILTNFKDITMQFNKNIMINCPHMQIANSLAHFSAQLSNDFSKGIVAKNVNFVADNIDLNYLIPIFKNLPKNSDFNMTISDGKSAVEKFKAGGVVANNINSDITYKNNILYLNNLQGDSYLGKIGGDINYDFIRRKTRLNLQGRGLSANPAIIALTARNDDIRGQLDFDSNISMIGYSKNELLSNLNGNVKFLISNGKMGVLGKLEHLLYAQNILSNNVFKATLNAIVKAITVKNTGVYKYMQGEIAFSNGWANINWIKTSGPTMSLYLTGRCYLPDNTANLIILGRISDDVVKILGPIGEFSVNKAISSIPKIGEISSYFANQFTTNPSSESISMIPYLTPKTELPSKEFKVIIDGDVQRQNSVKSFKWLSRPKIIQSQNELPVSSQNPISEVPDFINRLPDLKK